MNPLQSAKLDLVVAYAINSMFWSKCTKLFYQMQMQIPVSLDSSNYFTFTCSAYICSVVARSKQNSGQLSPTFSVRPCSSVGRVTVDLIRRSWVRFPPRSKDFFFASCGSLFPFTRANAQWVIHGFKQHFNLHFRVNSLFHYLILTLSLISNFLCYLTRSIHGRHVQIIRVTRPQSLFLALGALVRPGVNF